MAASIREVGVLQPIVVRALRTVAEERSVRDIEDLVRDYTGRAPAPSRPRGAKAAASPNGSYGEVEEILSEQLQTRVRIEMGKRRGKIVVEFGSAEDLDRIVAE